jgi:hypothetical protein
MISPIENSVQAASPSDRALELSEAGPGTWKDADGDHDRERGRDGSEQQVGHQLGGEQGCRPNGGGAKPAQHPLVAVGRQGGGDRHG